MAEEQPKEKKAQTKFMQDQETVAGGEVFTSQSKSRQGITKGQGPGPIIVAPPIPEIPKRPPTKTKRAEEKESS